MSETPSSEESFLRRLGAALGRTDPVPEAVLLDARAAIAWRTIDAALLEITRDTLAEPAGEGVRSPGAPRLVSFEDEERAVTIEVREEAGAQALRGRIEPPGPPVVCACHPGGEVRGEVGPDGHFGVRGLAHGPMSLLIEPGGSGWTRVFRTGWLAI